MTTQQYIQEYSNMAIVSSLLSKVFPSVKLAQATLESNSGNSQLTTQYHNHFGIKSNAAWTGESVDMNTGEVYNGQQVDVSALFRAYQRDKDSYLDHTRFLEMNTNYAAALQAATPEEQAQAIAAAGYATDPEYADKLIAIINEYDLKQLDQKKNSISLVLAH